MPNEDEKKTAPATARLEEESRQAYAAFIAYINLGDERSLFKVGRKLQKSTQLLSRWSAKYRWQERLAYWHTEQAELARKADEQALLERAREKHARREKLEADAADLSERLFEKARAMLNFPLAKQTTKDKGKTIIIHPGPWRIGDAARMADVGDSLGRLALGMPGKVIEVGGKDGAPIPIAPPIVRVRKLTNKESDEVMRKMEAESKEDE